MKLLIAIPALDEEANIASIIERTLAARSHIIASSSVESVAITVVSDGSTDRTVDIARHFTENIHLIVFPKNRGYGAAIKAAWEGSDADLLGFLDADGTCEPEFFATLCQRLVDSGSDVSIGNRMTRESGMPPLRRLGNRLFASLLTFLSTETTHDSASGMRVIRRSSLASLLPLPDGLHFTPAMSARAILSDSLRIVEAPMPYHERVGRSKLSVIRDGLRFIDVILQAALLYRPGRVLAPLGFALLLFAFSLMLRPLWSYWENATVAPWMIYRFVVSHLAGTGSLLLLSAAYLANRIVRITLGSEAIAGNKTLAEQAFSSRWFWTVPAGCLTVAFLLVANSSIELATTGVVFGHWSRFIAMSFFASAALIVIATRAVDSSLGLVASRLHYLSSLKER